MDRKTLEEMGKRYPKVGPTLAITFKSEGINALRVLMRLGQKGLVDFECMSLVLAITEFGEWGPGDSRVIKVRFPLGLIFQNEIFLERVGKDIESIRLASKHPLDVLMTGRQKVQKDNAVRIISDCYGDLIHSDLLNDLQLQLMGELEIVYGLPQITFTLRSLGTYRSTIVLDGWSGQIIIDGTPQQKAYSDPKKFHDIVTQMAEEYLEKMTAPA